MGNMSGFIKLGVKSSFGSNLINDAKSIAKVLLSLYMVASIRMFARFNN